ncbi:MAG: twin-arginine translocation signal domain-containing protein, partial [Acidobacteriota bacterium]
MQPPGRHHPSKLLPSARDLDRRRFLRLAAAGLAVAGGAVSTACQPGASPRTMTKPVRAAEPGSGQRVLVIGAGIAGLAAAR